MILSILLIKFTHLVKEAMEQVTKFRFILVVELVIINSTRAKTQK